MKRGISMVPLKWGVHDVNNPVSATVSIMSNDGSVFITHSGVEMGQGKKTIRGKKRSD
jgi:xanthine dehydrogenase molybdopterin-binding subunit B